jgi:hypothetical protein
MSGVVVGRPWGGAGSLFRKELRCWASCWRLSRRIEEGVEMLDGGAPRGDGDPGGPLSPCWVERGLFPSSIAGDWMVAVA